MAFIWNVITNGSATPSGVGVFVDLSRGLRSQARFDTLATVLDPPGRFWLIDRLCDAVRGRLHDRVRNS